MSQLQEVIGRPASDTLEFLTWAKRSGISIGVGSFILIGPPSQCILASVHSIMYVPSTGGICVQEALDLIEMDEYGCLFANLITPSNEHRLLSLEDELITALWHYPDEECAHKTHFIIKW